MLNFEVRTDTMLIIFSRIHNPGPSSRVFFYPRESALFIFDTFKTAVTVAQCFYARIPASGRSQLSYQQLL